MVSMTQAVTHARMHAAATTAASVACMPVHGYRFMHACTQQQQHRNQQHACRIKHAGSCMHAGSWMHVASKLVLCLSADACVRTAYVV